MSEYLILNLELSICFCCCSVVDFARVEKLDEVPGTRLQKLKERRLQNKQYIKKLGIEIKIPNMKQVHDDAGSHEY